MRQIFEVMRRFSTAIAFALLLVFPVFLQGKNSVSDEDVFSLSLEQLLDIPIVAASTRNEKPSDTPATALVISAEVIKNRGYTNLLDLLEDVPQIDLIRKAEVGRGNYISAMGVHGVERLQIMIDGIRVTPVTGNLYALGHQFSLQNARQVEIILGPMSSVYGADVFSGVINIVTGAENGSGKGKNTLHSEFGSFGSTNFSLSANHGLHKNLTAALTLHRFSSDGPLMPKYYPKDYSWYNNEFQSGRMLNFPGSAAETKVPFRPFNAEEEAEFIHLRLNHKDFEFGLMQMTEQHSSSQGALPQFSIYDESAVFKTHYQSLYARHLHHDRNERWKLQSQISHHFYELDPATSYINNFSGYKPGYKYARDKSTAIEERLTCNLGNNRHLTLGLTYQKHDSLPRTGDLSHRFERAKDAAEQGFIYPGSELSLIQPQGIPLETYRIKYDNVGGYAQLQLNSDARFQYIIGARYDKNSLYGSSFNPRLGVVYRANDRTNIKLLYGTAYLAPPPDKTYAHYGSFATDPNNPGDIKSFYLHIPNPNLKPEKISSLQSEISYRIEENQRLTLNLYKSHITDLHQIAAIGAGTFKGKPVDVLAHWVNKGKSDVFGGSIRYDALHQYENFQLNFYLALAFADGDENGDELPYSSRRSARAGLTFRQKRWTVSPRLIYQDKSHLQYKNAAGKQLSSPSFTTVNLFAKYNLSSGSNTSMFVNISNLFDRRYYHPGFAEGGVGFIQVPQAPRYISGGVSYDF